MVDADGITKNLGGNVQLVYCKQEDSPWKAVSQIWN